MIYYITRELNELFVNIKIMNQYILKEKNKKDDKEIKINRDFIKDMYL